MGYAIRKVLGILGLLRVFLRLFETLLRVIGQPASRRLVVAHLFMCNLKAGKACSWMMSVEPLIRPQVLGCFFAVFMSSWP